MKGIKLEKVISVNGRRYSHPELAAQAIADKITMRINEKMTDKVGQAWYHVVGVDHIHNLKNRAYRRVLPICENTLK